MFILLAILPVLLVYIFLSRYIVKGVTAGSVKGCAVLPTGPEFSGING